MDDVKNRLLSKIIVNEDTQCWEWVAAKRAGYGVIRVNRKAESTHRVSYKLFKGDIPEGLFVCHRCDNRVCINPDHLFIGTHSDNMVDAFNKGRIVIPENSRFIDGHLPSNRRLSISEQKEVKGMISNRGEKSLKDLSIELELPYQLLRDINCGRVYK